MTFSLLNEEESYLSAHIADLQRLSVRSGVPRFSAFLNEREAVVAENSVKGRPCFYGGYDGAARVICGFVENTYAEELAASDCFPIVPLTFTFRQRDKLSHRDFLGAMLSLQIKRELVGDILTAEGYAVVFVHETAAELVSALDKIGKVGVSCQKGITMPIPQQQTKRIETTVSSLRLDCIVSAAVNISRDRSASLIKSGMVNADFSPCLNVSAEVKENTVISVRGSGRFRLSEISGESRKGRLRIIIEKYI